MVPARSESAPTRDGGIVRRNGFQRSPEESAWLSESCPVAGRCPLVGEGRSQLPWPITYRVAERPIGTRQNGFCPGEIELRWRGQMIPEAGESM